MFYGQHPRWLCSRALTAHLRCHSYREQDGWMNTGVRLLVYANHKISVYEEINSILVSGASIYPDRTQRRGYSIQIGAWVEKTVHDENFNGKLAILNKIP